MTKPSDTPVRSRKGQQTRERLLGAAIAEFRRAGMAAADTGAIVAAAGVAHATFFFHFPTKEHVLIELERREEERMAAELARRFATAHDVRATLTGAIDVLDQLKRRLGRFLFKDFVGLHFSATAPSDDEWTTHPLILAVVEDLQRARDAGEIPAEVDVMHNGISFLVGLYALLIAIPEPIRDPFLDEYLTTYLRGLRVLPD